VNAAGNAYSLASLLHGVECCGPVPGLTVTGLSDDSRAVVPGGVFVAVRGSRVDGHEHIREAVRRGCGCVVAERGRVPAGAADGAVLVEVNDSRRALGIMARNMHGRPDAGMTLVAVTGTNGKTTVSYLLEGIFAACGHRVGVLGTISWRWPGETLSARLTTPGPLEIFSLLARMRDAGVTHLVMEVSSHALDQDRVAGLGFDAALFTNLSRDHLDYHQDMESYYQAKKKLFTAYLKDDGCAVICRPGEDDSASVRLFRELAAGGARVFSCGRGDGGDFVVRDARTAPVEFTLETPAGRALCRSPLVGDFNVENVALACSAAVCLGADPAEAARGVAGVRVPGRLERVHSGAEPSVYVDYAHTPGALARVLGVLAASEPRRLVVVFGCGGNRDRGKRKLMGAAAARIADVVAVTSDNPRDEDPAVIAAEVEEGIREAAGSGPGRLPRMELAGLMRSGARGYDVVLSREEAIATVITEARSGDVIAICGKGHEDYQEVRGQRSFFDDREVARRFLAGREAARTRRAGAVS